VAIKIADLQFSFKDGCFKSQERFLAVWVMIDDRIKKPLYGPGARKCKGLS